MSGRYAFSFPEPRQRDGWFRIGSLDVTTTVGVVMIGVASMLLYAISPRTAYWGVFISTNVRAGELWRLATWPLVNPPSIWIAIGLAVFWWVGNIIEEELGRKPYTVLLGAMTVIPAAVVTLVGSTNAVSATNPDRWQAASASVDLLVLGLIVIFALDKPNARFFFNIPGWVLAAVYVGISVLQYVAYRAWADLLLMLLVVVVGCFGARQRGMLDELGFIPRIGRLAGPPRSPYGEPPAARAKPKRGRGGRSKGNRAHPTNATVVSGPWASSGGPTPLEQAELDVLLDRISEGGLDSLTPHEKARLQALSKRMRDS